MNHLNGVRVSRFTSAMSNQPVEATTLDHVYKGITAFSGALVTQVERVRHARNAGEEAYAEAKKNLPAITPSGVFHPTRAADNLIGASGLVVLDYDHLAAEEVSALKAWLKDQPETVMAFMSPSMQGVKAFVAVTPSPRDAAGVTAAWQAVADSKYGQQGYEIDPSGKDASRLCFMSHDRDCYYAPENHAQIAWAYPAPPPPPAERVSTSGDTLVRGKPSHLSVQAALTHIPCAALPYDEWLKVGQGLHADGYPIAIWEAWSKSDPRYKEGECARKWAGFSGGKGVTIASVIHMAKQHGYEPPRGRRPSPAREQRDAAIAETGIDWQQTANGGIAVQSIQNARLALTAIGVSPRWDTLLAAPVVSGKQVDDADIRQWQNTITLRFGKSVQYEPTMNALTEAVYGLAEQNRYHPILDDLPAWDGIDRLDSGDLCLALGARFTELNVQIAALIVRGMVARQVSAGCAFPYVPILYSPKQGRGKTLALHALSLGHHREGLDLDGFDAHKKIVESSGGYAIVELGEIDSIGGKRLNALKNLATERELSVRLAYGRTATNWQIATIWVATTNHRSFLTDTENRRFPVLHVESDITLDWLHENAPQLWAQAVAEYVPHAPVTLPASLWDESEANSADHRMVSEFEDWASAWVSSQFNQSREWIPANELNAAYKESDIRTNNHEKSRVMHALGWQYNLSKRGWRRA